ncbi:hypothetical protein NLG97_g3709 [Lecanicillium saksenae]|uniref:Uncharacterized protein n=1 Tax=Lecanicillium saksenae TaxID=468837 RepID=A0ACC1QXH2_9HYPO|nr:hypothetical protein NLG97_g3709 [Lecanicillium saksenae]
MSLNYTEEEAALNSLLKKGFYSWEEAYVGSRVLALQEKKFPYFTEYGLDFCADFAFDPRITQILETSFQKCLLGHWLRYEEYPNHIECFRRGGLKAGRKVFVVQVWSRDSEVDYYAGSHDHELVTTRSLRSLHEIPSSELARVGCVADKKKFANGALVIMDARLGFEIRTGYAITFMFGTEDVVASWPKIVLPNSAVLAKKIEIMEARSKRIGLNITFHEEGGLLEL